MKPQLLDKTPLKRSANKRDMRKLIYREKFKHKREKTKYNRVRNLSSIE